MCVVFGSSTLKRKVNVIQYLTPHGSLESELRSLPRLGWHGLGWAGEAGVGGFGLVGEMGGQDPQGLQMQNVVENRLTTQQSV